MGCTQTDRDVKCCKMCSEVCTGGAECQFKSGKWGCACKVGFVFSNGQCVDKGPCSEKCTGGSTCQKVDDDYKCCDGDCVSNKDCGAGFTCTQTDRDVKCCKMCSEVCTGGAECQFKSGKWGCACPDGSKDSNGRCVDEVDEVRCSEKCTGGLICQKLDDGPRCACKVGFNYSNGRCVPGGRCKIDCVTDEDCGPVYGPGGGSRCK